MASILIRHNIEVAHRLIETEGKCQNIHGHSMWVTLELFGRVDKTGKLAGLEFGQVKETFREWLDENFDHHLLLNDDDLLAEEKLPGAVMMHCDPTTENIAASVYHWARGQWPLGEMHVEVQETHSNFARYP